MSESPGPELVGRQVASISGERIGRIERVVEHGDGDGGPWAEVKRGLLQGEVFVPLRDAVESEEGELRVVYERDHVAAAPDVDVAEGARLSDDQAELLHRHYGLERITAATVDGHGDVELPRETREATPPALAEGEDNPLTRRRLERAEELGVPVHHDADGSA